MRVIYLLFTVLFACFLISSSQGRAAAAGEGNTGAPGDDSKVCASCHQGGSFNVEGEIQVLNSDLIAVEEYIPGEEYTVQLTVNANGASVYGFQMVSLFDSNNEDTDGFSEVGAGVQLVPLNGRKYVEHDGPSTNNVFETTWVAPEPGSNDVSFYASVNAANGNGNNLGDHATTTQVTLTEFISSSDQLLVKQLSLYPNPVTDILSIDKGELDVESLEIYNVTGQKELSLDEFNSQVDVGNLSSGLYIVSLTTTTGIRVQKKLMKK